MLGGFFMVDWLLFRFFRRSVITRLLFIITCLVIFFGIIMHITEPQTFFTIFDGIWWVVITISTIGYGDFVPDTVIGKLIAMLLILIGTGFITTYFVSLATIAVSKENAYLEGNLKFLGDGHLIIIGWNERARLVIEEYKKAFHEEVIVLIDSSLKKNPMICDRLHFIKGSASDSNTLSLANLSNAKKVLITADQHTTEEQADMQTIVTLVAIKGVHPSVYLIAELLTEKHIRNAETIGVNEIIKTNEIISQLMHENIFVTKLKE